MRSYIQVSTTLASEDEAKQLARLLIERRLAACVQIDGPTTSTYRWQGEVEEAQEWRCTAKTLADSFSRISQAIADAHPYDVPEIVAVPLVDVSASYAAWLDQQID